MTIATRGSTAVMARRVEPPTSLDFFPTPPWATRALTNWLADQCWPIGLASAWEPACGQGDMARALAEAFREVHASDVHDYGAGEVADFLWPTDRRADWVITNPPFRLADQFISKAISVAHEGVAMLVRTSFLEGAGRYHELFKATPPTDILQFVERVPMYRGRLVQDGTTATAYCWLVWILSPAVPRTADVRFHWIPPCRRRLERPGDYGLRP